MTFPVVAGGAAKQTAVAGSQQLMVSAGTEDSSMLACINFPVVEKVFQAFRAENFLAPAQKQAPKTLVRDIIQSLPQQTRASHVYFLVVFLFVLSHLIRSNNLLFCLAMSNIYTGLFGTRASQLFHVPQAQRSMETYTPCRHVDCSLIPSILSLSVQLNKLPFPLPFPVDACWA